MSSQVQSQGSVSADLVDGGTVSRGTQADWNAYASEYDLLSDHNPEYRALQRDFEAFLATIETPDRIVDIGGGTGNYTQIAARCCPGSAIRLVEPHEGMIAVARRKLSDFRNITYDTATLESVDAPGTADLVVCVHALYTMPDPDRRLADLRRLLRPGGWLYLIDLGRRLDVKDWRAYLFSHLRREHGVFRALRILWQSREIAKQNTAIERAQTEGVYRTHTAEEFASAVTAAGFDIHRQETVYRGYSDLIVARARA
ncbi:class I SAM-dependent methyltransferase [Salipiger sp. IMCC34102]|uniref:class I SAM-dependent methyltransferase n=1 Tax=Salipiger sp. IMCC34102 TaxID=2510647 RepID=UPI00101BA160|nr:class I SAM-dependent methyltransferase [Salipiger sp. IMCC34102]RYH01456.1 class I SAM-dependent methyltransferase [Salipiger sp. IMCC34102]